MKYRNNSIWTWYCDLFNRCKKCGSKKTSTHLWGASKTRCLSGCLIFLLTFYLNISNVYAANIVTNPGFETSGSNPWTYNSPWVRSSSSPYSGTYSAYYSGSGTGGLINNLYPFTVTTSTTYELTFYANINVTSGNQPVLEINQTGGGFSGNRLSQTLANTSGYQLHTYTFTTDATNTTLYFRLFNNSGTSNLYIDDISIDLPAPTPTPTPTSAPTPTPTPTSAPTPTPTPSTISPELAEGISQFMTLEYTANGIIIFLLGSTLVFHIFRK